MPVRWLLGFALLTFVYLCPGASAEPLKNLLAIPPGEQVHDVAGVTAEQSRAGLRDRLRVLEQAKWRLA
jgi:hypothetical protein